MIKRLLIAGGLLAGLSGCGSNVRESITDDPSLLENKLFTNVSTEMNSSLLISDNIPLQGLRDFYSASIDPNVQDTNIFDNVVILDIVDYNGNKGHGYLINDCGLVLTANHVVKNLNKPGLESLVNGTMINRNGEVFPIKNIELKDEFLDFAIVYVETGKESKAHPLNFSKIKNSPCGMDASFIAVDFSIQGDNVYKFSNGKVLCVDDILEKVKDDKWTQNHSLSLGELALKGSVFLDTNIKYGYSGSPVFSDVGSDRPIFLGLVRCGFLKNEYIGGNPRIPSNEFMDGFTAITTSNEILIKIKDYLDNLDSP